MVRNGTKVEFCCDEKNAGSFLRIFSKRRLFFCLSRDLAYFKLPSIFLEATKKPSQDWTVDVQASNQQGTYSTYCTCISLPQADQHAEERGCVKARTELASRVRRN
jgi:hypothetical protein